MESFTARNYFRAVKTRFLPRTSHFLPAGDMGGGIKVNTYAVHRRVRCSRVHSDIPQSRGYTAPPHDSYTSLYTGCRTIQEGTLQKGQKNVYIIYGSIHDHHISGGFHKYFKHWI